MLDLEIESIGATLPSPVNRVYMVGTSDLMAEAQVCSVDDFTDRFGPSPSLASVRLFFANAPDRKLYFVRSDSQSLANFIEAVSQVDLAGNLLIAPEAFQVLDLFDRAQLAQAMNQAAIAAKGKIFCDCGPNGEIGSVKDFLNEVDLYGIKPQNYCMPHILDEHGDPVPSSAAVAALYISQFR